MNWFRNRSTAIKINSVVILMAMFITMVGYVGYSYTKKGNDALNDTYSNGLLSVKYVNDARTNIRAGEVDVLSIILSEDQNLQQELLQDLKIRGENVDQDLKFYSGISKEPYEQERFAKLSPVLQTYRTERDKALQMDSAGDDQGAYKYYLKNAKPSINTFNGLLQELADYNAQAAELQSNKRLPQSNPCQIWRLTFKMKQQSLILKVN